MAQGNLISQIIQILLNPDKFSQIFRVQVTEPLPVVNRQLINSNNDDDEPYEALVNIQTTNDKIYDTSRSSASFSLGSTVVIQWEDGGPWTYGTVVERGDHKHSNRSYMI